MGQESYLGPLLRVSLVVTRAAAIATFSSEKSGPLPSPWRCWQNSVPHSLNVETFSSRKVPPAHHHMALSTGNPIPMHTSARPAGELLLWEGPVSFLRVFHLISPDKLPIDYFKITDLGPVSYMQNLFTFAL